MRKRGERGAAVWCLAAAVLAAPPAVFGWLVRHPEHDVAAGSPATHFYIVSAVSLLAFGFAIAVIVAARRLPDARTFFLTMGFLSMATIFVAHGLGTSPLFHANLVGVPVASEHATHAADPDEGYLNGYGGYGGPESTTGTTLVPDGVTIARSRVVGYSAQISLLVSGIFFALTAIDLGDRKARFVLRHRSMLTGSIWALLASHVAIALAFPELMAWLPIGSDPLRLLIAGTAVACLGFAAWRFFQAYRLAMLPLQGAMALGMVLLIEAQYFMLEGRLWRFSWWEYHAVLFAGFSLCIGALMSQRRLTGDLGAVVEGLFLRQHVSGLRGGDPRALRALLAAVTAKDGETAEHIERVGELAVAIGRRLGLEDDRLLLLGWAGRLHDVGKIGVPNAILRKPGKLTAREFEIIKLHSPRGGQIAERSEMLTQVAAIVRAHHERMDGSGYPDGLRGEEIPFEARIVAAADVWDALICDRPYRAALSKEDAATIVAAASGPHLDPVCVEALFAELGISFPKEEQQLAA